MLHTHTHITSFSTTKPPNCITYCSSSTNFFLSSKGNVLPLLDQRGRLCVGIVGSCHTGQVVNTQQITSSCRHLCKYKVRTEICMYACCLCNMHTNCNRSIINLLLSSVPLISHNFYQYHFQWSRSNKTTSNWSQHEL